MLLQMRVSFVRPKNCGFRVLPLVRLLLLCGVSALVGIGDSVSSPYFCPLVRWAWFFIVFTDTVSNLQVPWIRCVRLWVHRICKVCYTGTLWPIKDPHIMRSLSSPDFCYTFPGLHNEETGRAKNLPTLGCSHLNIQHSLLFRRPGLKWEALSGALCHPHLSHLLSVYVSKCLSA